MRIERKVAKTQGRNRLLGDGHGTEGARRQPTRGEGWNGAIVGMSVGALLLLLGFSMFWNDFQRYFFPRPHHHGPRCTGNLKQIGLALIIYAGDDPDFGFFPDGGDFAQLNDGRYLPDGKVYSCPDASVKGMTSTDSNYVYLGRGLKDTNASSTQVILAHDKLGNHVNWVNCVYLDGHAKGHRTRAVTWDEFRAEREADGDVIANDPLTPQPDLSALPSYQKMLEDH